LVKARFGAPVSLGSYFPLDETAAAALTDLLPLEQSALSAYPTAETPQDTLVQLFFSDGSAVTLTTEGAQIILGVEERYYDCTGGVDFDQVCRTLEAAQLRAVLADLVDVNSMKLIDTEDSSYNKSAGLTPLQSAELQELLQTDQWFVPDMYTAQDLAQGWPQFIQLYHSDRMIAKLSYGGIQGTRYTVIFYPIGGDEEQTASVLAPWEVYHAIKAMFGLRASRRTTPQPMTDRSGICRMKARI
jgi:hypothetical protein